VEHLPAGQPRIHRDPARLEGQRLAGGVDGPLEVRKGPGFPALVEDPAKVGGHLVFETGRVRTGPPA
jgi:hypothetical protein